MRVAEIYEIHGNLPALEAVLQEIHQSDADQIVVGGDVIIGPMSRESLDRLQCVNIPVHFIQGNCEVSVLAQLTGKDPGSLPQQVLETIQWTAKQLNAEHEQLLAGWSKNLHLEIAGLGEVLFCHATPRNENECFTRLTPEDKLLPIFKELNVDLVVCGHTYMQFDRMIGNIRVVNAGSVGMPFGKPGAYWLLLGTSIEFRYTSYDIIEEAKRVKNTTYPQAEDSASNNILQPPSEDKMLEVFSNLELG